MAEGVLAIDSDVLSAWLKGDLDLRERFTMTTPALPAPVVQEACYGWILAAGKAQQRHREDLVALYLDRLVDLVEFCRAATVLRYTPAAQNIYRSLAHGRGHRGRSDLRIAAICVAHAVPLLTRNVSHFADLPELTLVEE